MHKKQAKQSGSFHRDAQRGAHPSERAQLARVGCSRELGIVSPETSVLKLARSLARSPVRVTCFLALTHTRKRFVFSSMRYVLPFRFIAKIMNLLYAYTSASAETLVIVKTFFPFNQAVTSPC